MKNIIKIFILSLILSSCGDFEPVVYDTVNGQTGIGFPDSTIDLSVPVGGVTSTVELYSTTTSSQARTFNLTVDEALSSVAPGDYSLGTASIPADSFNGTLDVTFNYDGLEDFVENTLVVNVEVADGIAFSPLTFTFLREFDINEFICADLTLTIEEDNYADERDWDITDSSGAIVAQCSDFSSCPGGAPSGSLDPATYVYAIPTLAPGDYTFTIYDAFGDGLSDGSITGTYDLTCTAQSVVSYASGSGNFGSSESTAFTINQ